MIRMQPQPVSYHMASGSAQRGSLPHLLSKPTSKHAQALYLWSMDFMPSGMCSHRRARSERVEAAAVASIIKKLFRYPELEQIS